MENDDIAKVLDETADMLEVAGENFCRVQAYHNAARAIRDQTTRVADLTEEQIDEIHGIGADLAAKITKVIRTGDLPLHHELGSKFTPHLLELRDIPGLGPKRLKVLIDRLGICDRGDLEKAIKSDKLRKIRGFGPRIEERIRESLLRHDARHSQRILYSEAVRIGRPISEHLQKCPAIQALQVAGSFRQRCDTVGDLDVVAAAANPEMAMKHFAPFSGIAQVTGSGATNTTVLLKSHLQVDLRVVPLESFGAALLYSTGSKSTMCICVALHRSVGCCSTSMVSFAMALLLPVGAKRTFIAPWGFPLYRLNSGRIAEKSKPRRLASFQN